MLDVEFSIASRQTGSDWLIELTGELDLYTVSQLRKALDAIPEDSERLLIDLREVTFIDSTGIGALLGARRAGEHALVLRVGHPSVMRALEVCGVDGLFDIRHG